MEFHDKKLKASAVTRVYSLCVFPDNDNNKAQEGPTSAVAVAPKIHLTLNHLVFHKVLGKGSFGKVISSASISELLCSNLTLKMF